MGKLRILSVNGATLSSGKIATLPTEDRPTSNIITMSLMVLSNVFYPSFLDILSNGDILNANYIPRTNEIDRNVTGGLVYANIVWTV